MRVLLELPPLQHLRAHGLWPSLPPMCWGSSQGSCVGSLWVGDLGWDPSPCGEVSGGPMLSPRSRWRGSTPQNIQELATIQCDLGLSLQDRCYPGFSTGQLDWGHRERSQYYSLEIPSRQAPAISGAQAPHGQMHQVPRSAAWRAFMASGPPDLGRGQCGRATPPWQSHERTSGATSEQCLLEEVPPQASIAGEKAESDSAAMAPVPVKAMPTSLFLPLAPAERKAAPISPSDDLFRLRPSELQVHLWDPVTSVRSQQLPHHRLWLQPSHLLLSQHLLREALR